MDFVLSRTEHVLLHNFCMLEKSLRSWREILSFYCENPQKKQEIANAVGFVTVRTIDRWISGQSSPQKSDTVRKLSQVINTTEMFEALEYEFPEAFQSKNSLLSVERGILPSEFYQKVVHAYAYTPLLSRHWTILHLVANQMLPHLDPERTGLVMICTKYTTSMPEDIIFEEGAGNTFWTTRQLQDVTGAEPQLVQAIMTCHPFFIQSCSTSGLFPPLCLWKRDLIQGMGFFPLYRAGAVAAGLLLCSTQLDFFTPLRQALIEAYACLFALAFSDEEFH